MRRGRPSKYTAEHEAYMREHYHYISPTDIAKVIGAPCADAVVGYARKLLARGMVFKHTEQPPNEEKEPHKKIDGYDIVPWHMRIDGRNQFVPTMNYDAVAIGDV